MALGIEQDLEVLRDRQTWGKGKRVWTWGIAGREKVSV